MEHIHYVDIMHGYGRTTMPKEEYEKHYKDFILYSCTLTCIISGYLLEHGILFDLPQNYARIVAPILFLAGYYMVYVIAQKLKKKVIHGITAIAWSAITLYFLSNFINSEAPFPLWVCIIRNIALIIALFFMINGVFRLMGSLIYLTKKADKETIESINVFTAVITATLTICSVAVQIFNK